ncbi:MAG: acetyltransferase [Bacteroidetes bacterium]|nr:acetyltransferase [Bacteroidota bacterium]
MSRLILIGAGGHGKVVADIAHAMQKWESIEFLDDKFPELALVASWQVTGKLNEYNNLDSNGINFGVTIGENKLRFKLIQSLLESGLELPSLVHPTAFVNDSIELGDGTVIMAQAAINIDSCVETGCVINTGATVDHDCMLANGVHLSPGVLLAGEVKIGERSWIGIGATVNRGITIGNDVMIGAGAVVINDIEDGLTVVGNPAKPVHRE